MKSLSPPEPWFLQWTLLRICLKRQYALDRVAEAWFENYAEKQEAAEKETLPIRLQKLKDKQKGLEKAMNADSFSDWEIVEDVPKAAPLENRRDISEIDSFTTLTREEYNAKSREEKKQYMRDLNTHK